MTVVCAVARLPVNAFTHRPKEASLIPSCWATVETRRPVLITSFTAALLHSGVNSRQALAMMNILFCEVSTNRDQGHSRRLPSMAVVRRTCSEVLASTQPDTSGLPMTAPDSLKKALMISRAHYVSLVGSFPYVRNRLCSMKNHPVLEASHA